MNNHVSRKFSNFPQNFEVEPEISARAEVLVELFSLVPDCRAASTFSAGSHSSFRWKQPVFCLSDCLTQSNVPTRLYSPFERLIHLILANLSGPLPTRCLDGFGYPRKSADTIVWLRILSVSQIRKHFTVYHLYEFTLNYSLNVEPTLFAAGVFICAR
jgi:hypothetical protein